MEFATISGTPLSVSRVGLGTWAIGGWMWGGTDEEESVKTIHAAVERGINLIDTAPAYGFGHSEEIVGRAIDDRRLRSLVVIATKAGLEWKDGKVFRNASRDRILREVTDSLRRLRTDYIDIYQLHWPDPLVPLEETAEAMQTLLEQDKIRAIGVSNFSTARFRRVAFAVAETGSVLLSDTDLRVNAVAYLAQHLIVLLDPADIVLNLHHAYRRPEFHDRHYASFHTGPSATADIEGVLIHGAQGVRSLSVLPIAREAENTAH